MTVQEFKKAHPEYANLEGDALWDTMTAIGLQRQQGNSIILSALPFWKRYKLRYLFIKSNNGWKFQKADASSKTRCKICKKPIGLVFGYLYMGKMYRMCGDHELIEEPNTSFAHKAYIYKKKALTYFWKFMEILHIVKLDHVGRYGMFGEESHYVKNWTFNIETGKSSYSLKPRKWFEYIIIKKR